VPVLVVGVTKAHRRQMAEFAVKHRRLNCEGAQGWMLSA